MESDTPRTDALREADGLRRLIVAEELERELAAAIKQRDEVRRMWCLSMMVRYATVGIVKSDKEIAAERGWDCYAQEGGGACGG